MLRELREEFRSGIGRNSMAKIKDLPKTDKPREKHKGAGHRKRLRNRFLQSGLNGFLDYEIVELLLTLGTPRRDCKQIAKEAIKLFRGLRGVLDASIDELQQVKGIGPSNAFGVKLFQAVAERYAHERVLKPIKLDSPKLVADYLRRSIGREKKEHFVALCLDAKNNLIKVSSVSTGTLNESLVHPREVFKEAVDAHSSQIIVGHNHPSGDTKPSRADILLTKRLVSAGTILGIEVLDHIIVSRSGFYSLREANLL